VRRALVGLVLVACSGQSGTLAISLATAPGSNLLDSAESLKLTLTYPAQTTTATRSSTGFDITIDVPADGNASQLYVDALDATGTLLATGQSPPFALGAEDSTLVVYMAPPLSVGVAPVALASGRDQIAAGSLGYGVILAGGIGAAGALDDVEIYNGFTHALQTGMVLPAARGAMALGIGQNGVVYFFGGTDATGATVGNLWRFDTTVAPNGSYIDDGDQAGVARTGALALAIDSNDDYLVTGTPPGALSGTAGTVTARTDFTALPDQGATVVGSDGVASTIMAGVAGSTTGLVRFRAGAFDTPDGMSIAARTGHTVVALEAGKVAVVCGGSAFPDALVIDAATAAASIVPTVPAVPVSECAAAATSRYVVIAGGSDATGAVSAAVDIYDATTLAYVASTTLVTPRTGASAVALPNGQILFAGGVDAEGNFVETLELFTPDSPE